MIIDPSKLDPKSVYKLLIGSVVPRPIAWISTVSRGGIRNLAPFSFFTVASRQPPMLCVSVEPRPDEGSAKDTLGNIEETGEFVINIVSLPLSNAMYESSKSHPPEIDEFEAASLTPAPCEVVEAPRVGEAGVNMECLLDRVLTLGTDHLVIGRMVRFHVRDELYQQNSRIDVASLKPLGRLAGNYTKVETVFELPAEDL
ncbi:MAG TPA: flavin reductase family protein [Rubrobacteraceae bacterium]|nr:flavin reductase family protein [Rubrobacteraceae bacterium]